MGGWFTKLFTFTTEKKLLMVGLDASGKTTILYKLKLGENITSIPTIGFNVEEVSYKNFKMSIWDIGGQDKIRQLWKHYYENTDGLIFVIDAADDTRLKEAADELNKLHRETSLRNVPFLVFANKQDLPNAKSVEQILRSLNSESELISARFSGRPWMIQGCCATSGIGLYEGLDWLKNEMDKKK